MEELKQQKVKDLITKEGDYYAGKHKGYIYRVIRMNSGLSGEFHSLNGYVGVPKGHKLYGKDYNDMDISCHGGLTYSRDYLQFQPESDIWWIGFDTAHANDLYSFKYSYDDNAVYRDMEYVKNECKKIINQLVK
jgi:hypothetical protein